MNKLNKSSVISIILSLLCISTIITLSNIFKESTYKKKELVTLLKTKNISLLKVEKDKILFIDGPLKENNIEFYDESINDLNYINFDEYCCIYIFDNNNQAAKMEIFLGERLSNNIFREKNIIFFTNNVSLREKYLKYIRELEN